MLPDILKRLGLTWDKLTAEEKKTAGEWQKVLEAPELTMDDLRRFTEKELERLSLALEDYKNDQKTDLYLKAARRNMQLIHDIIAAPERNKAWLANHLKDRFGIQL